MVSKKNRAIIPAAGFGKRVGSPPAKELLLHPQYHKPQIEVALEISLKYDLEPLVVTREEKTELLSWLKKHYPNIPIQIIQPSKEWPDTVLQSKPFWKEHNFLILPDTDFAPHLILGEMKKSLINSFDAVFACFTPEKNDLQNWGVLQAENKKWFISDKPKTWNENAKAWGLIGFKKEVGEIIFQSILNSYFSENRDWKTLPLKIDQLFLSSFRDLAREKN